VAASIEAQVESGELEGRLPTIDELSEQFGVSRVTMQRAVRVLKEREVVVTAPKRGISTTRLRRPRAHILGAVLPVPGGSPLHDRLIAGLQQEAGERSEVIAVAPGTRDDPALEVEQIEMMLDKQRVDGIVLWPVFKQGKVSPGVELLKEARIPFVLVTECDPQLYHDCSTVNNLNTHGAAEVMTHLLGMGHRKIAFAAPKRSAKVGYVAYRYSQYEKAMKLAGLRPRKMLFMDGDKLKADAFKGISAIFCVNDDTAFIAIRICLKYGIRVPKDLAVVGYDNTPLAECLDLSSVEQHFERMGSMAVDLLLKDIEGELDAKPHLTAESELVLRSSSQSAD
jgi:LacI family transcriptional regulator